MAKIIGRQFQVGIGKETTRGTIVAPTYWVPFNDLTLDEKQEKVFDAQSYGIIEDSVAALTTKKYVEGSLSSNLHDTSFGLILYALLGTLTSHSAHSGESVVYDNIFNVAESTQHQSLTLAIHDPATSQDYAHANAVISKLEIKYALKQFVQFTASLMGQTGTTESAYTPSNTTENRFVPQYLNLNFAPTVAGVEGTLTATGTCSTTTAVTGLSISTTLLRIGMTVTGTNIPAGATIVAIVSASAFTLSVASTGSATSYTFGPAVVKVKSASITIDTNVEAQDVLGSLSPADFLNKEFKVDFSVEAIWQNESDFKTAFMANTSQAIIFDLKNTDVTIGSSTNPEFKLELPWCYITDLGRPIKVKDLIYQTIKGRAVYSLSSAYMLKATLTNTTNGY
jgi:tail tube protein